LKKNMEVDDPEKRRRIHAAIRKAARVARRRGVPVVPLREAREHLQAMFDDPFERARVIAAYDSLEDVIVFNPDHGAWADLVSYLRERKDAFSTQDPQHLVRHEIGHAVHHRSLSTSPKGRDQIWYAESLAPDHERIARRVSDRATWNPKEFVAEVFAGLWAKVLYDDEVIALFSSFGGVEP
jgi:hypothetical protein